MSKGSALSRAVRFFREADLDEMEVAFELVSRTVKGRLAERDAKAKSQRKAAETPRKTRKTKLQVAADTASATGAAAPEQGTLTAGA